MYMYKFIMAYELITNYENWQPSKITYGSVKVNARGGKSVKIMDEKKNTLMLNTPLIMTWGVNEIHDDSSGRTSYNMSIQYPSNDYGSNATRNFFEKMKEFEDKILNDAVKHSKEWFGKNHTREVLEALYSPILKYPKIKGTEDPDMTRAPTTRIKIPYWENKFNVELYDVNRVPLYRPGDHISESFESFIPKASHVALVVQCNGFWFVGGKFGVSFNMVQAIVKKPTRVQGNCYVSLNANDMQELVNIENRETEKNNNSRQEEIDDVQVDDDDDVQVNDDEPEPEPEPEPEEKPKKKRVIKRKPKAST